MRRATWGKTRGYLWRTGTERQRKGARTLCDQVKKSEHVGNLRGKTAIVLRDSEEESDEWM